MVTRVKRFHNEPTEAYFFLIKQVYNKIKSKKHIWIHTKRVESDVNEIIGHVNEKIQYGITLTNGKELERINATSTYDKEGENRK